MAWRLPAKAYAEGKGPKNRAAFRRLVGRKKSLGILAYRGKEPIGWCSISPRATFSFLSRSRTLRAVDDLAVWSVSCLFVARPFRKQGVSVDLLRAAVAFAKRRGARIVEGYPVVPYSETMPPVFAWTGTATAFIEAGFEEVARRSPGRPIMRRSVRSAGKVRQRRPAHGRPAR
jgi:GNAT superfamily N-acetyltransferase